MVLKETVDGAVSVLVGLVLWPQLLSEFMWSAPLEVIGLANKLLATFSVVNV
jgi:hypothetical protein